MINDTHGSYRGEGAHMLNDLLMSNSVIDSALFSREVLPCKTYRLIMLVPRTCAVKPVLNDHLKLVKTKVLITVVA